MTKEEVKELLRKFEEGECSDEERTLIMQWYEETLSSATPPQEVDFNAVRERVFKRLTGAKVRRLHYLRWSSAAAAILIIAFTALYLLKDQKQDDQSTALVQDIAPGGSRATLQLANGKKIVLDSAANGRLAVIPGITISKAANGVLVYKITGQRSAATTSGYHTINIPRGGQYKILLPDGTEVDLNAESSLKYPTNFAINKREVTLTGEAFFKVQSDPQRPFVVASATQRVQVLGTHFNVRAYPLEPIETTLEEGKVQITATSSPQKATLKPGDQSIVTAEGIAVRRVDPEGVIAWKDGMFVFNGSSLKDAMKQLCRWYDVDVEESSIPDMTFEGEIPRTLSLLKVLDIINAYSEYKFTLRERRIVRQ